MDINVHNEEQKYEIPKTLQSKRHKKRDTAVSQPC